MISNLQGKRVAAITEPLPNPNPSSTIKCFRFLTPYLKHVSLAILVSMSRCCEENKYSMKCLSRVFKNNATLLK